MENRKTTERINETKSCSLKTFTKLTNLQIERKKREDTNDSNQK